MKEVDIITCLDIAEQNFGSGVVSRTLRQLRDMHHGSSESLYWVAIDEEKVVAFAGMRPSWIMNGVWELIWINVDKAYRGRGIGRELTELRIIQAGVHGAAAINLMTQSPEFFEKFGFEAVKEYDQDDPENEMPWVLMTLQMAEVGL